MTILVASVHHNGTKLVFDDILVGVTDKVRIHLEPKFWAGLHIYAKGSDIIVPLRHPRIVAEGWKVRSKRREELGEQYRILKEEIDPYHPYYLPIEHEDRDQWLHTIGICLGLNLTTDWPVIGKCEDVRSKLDDKDEYLLSSWMEDGFFKKFGYS